MSTMPDKMYKITLSVLVYAPNPRQALREVAILAKDTAEDVSIVEVHDIPGLGWCEIMCED